VPRLEGKSVVSSRWLYKIKHAGDHNIEKFKARFVVKGSPNERERTTRKLLLQLPGTLPLEKLCR
jgi:hypothetical protein